MLLGFHVPLYKLPFDFMLVQCKFANTYSLSLKIVSLKGSDGAGINILQPYLLFFFVSLFILWFL